MENTQKLMVYFMEHPIKMDDLGGLPSKETSIYIYRAIIPKKAALLILISG
jgi:hypothetical protein